MRKSILVLTATICLFFLSCTTGYHVLTQENTPDFLYTVKTDTEISILTWNIGYAGLGKNAEFITDGGKSIISSTKKQVIKNLDAIKIFFSRYPADIFLIQEMALPSNVNRFVNVYEKITEDMPSYWASYSPKVAVVFPPVNVNVGGSVLSRIEPFSVERLELPLEDDGIMGIKQKHHLLIVRFYVASMPNELVVVNVHLSAFDENAKTRRNQLKTLNDFIRKEYFSGNYVICGGDWNLVLDRTSFPYTTEEKYLFWVHNLPNWFPPKGWKKATDPSEPTVRSLERPYIKNENYTTIIDGFILSPNVKMLEVKTINREFASSDHNPVRLKIKLIPAKKIKKS